MRPADGDGRIALPPFTESRSYVEALVEGGATLVAREAATRRETVQPALFVACERLGLGALERRALACVVSAMPLRWVDAAVVLRRLEALALVAVPDGIARPTSRLLALVADELQLDRGLVDARLVTPAVARTSDDALVPHALVDELIELIDAGELACVAADAEVGAAGRVATALARCGRAAIVTSPRAILGPGGRAAVARERLLFDAALVVDAAAVAVDALVETARALVALGGAVVLACDECAALRRAGITIVELPLGPPSLDERRRLWQRLLGELPLPSTVRAEELATLPLPRPELARELAQVAARSAMRGGAPAIDGARWEAAQARVLGQAPSLGRIVRHRAELAPSVRR
jgi:hypothetical protein